MSNENTSTHVTPLYSVQERTELFTQVAVALLSTRPLSVIDGSKDGAILSEHFVKEVALITESILAQAKTFGEK
jgi:hypothetical protein